MQPPSEAEVDAAGEPGKLRWQCRRGMRELDVLLTGYLDEGYRNDPPEGQSAFRRLLGLPDPVIHGYLLGRDEPPDPELSALIARIAAGVRIDR